jgi:hypothetical protein
VPAEQRAVVENHFDVLFRGALDRSLRATIAGGRAAEDTRVILLSDAQNEAFQNALLIACAAQGQGFNREDCLEPVYLIERLCDDKSAKFGTGRNPRGDACVLASLTYGRSLTSKADRDLEGVREARQLIQAQGHLREPGGPGADQSVVPCRDVKAQKMNTLVVGASDTYYRVDAAAENDDGLYLIDAAHAGLTMQADCMSGRVLERYEAILRAREP